MKTIDQLSNEVNELEERYLKAGEKEDELPKVEPPEADDGGGSNAKAMAQALADSVRASKNLTHLVRTGQQKEAIKTLLGPECMEKLEGYESSLGEMSDYLEACLNGKKKEDDEEEDDEESEDEEDSESDENEEQDDEENELGTQGADVASDDETGGDSESEE